MSDELSYKIYMSDALKAIYNILGGGVEDRYYDFISNEAKVESRTPEEIIEHIRSGLRKLSNGGN